MASSKRNNRAEFIFDVVRHQRVKKTPEEVVRQRLLKYLITICGFPAHLISVEKNLQEMAHIQGEGVGDRRADIICYANGIHPHHPLYPLLLVECKATPLSDSAVQQVLGYNTWVKAPFVVLANAEELRLYSPYIDEMQVPFSPQLFSYQELLERAKFFYTSPHAL